MVSLSCSACGGSVSSSDYYCNYCGEKLSFSKTEGNTNQVQQPQVALANPVQQNYEVKYESDKNKVAAGVLAFFLGGIGVHKFYLNQAGIGILYLVFSWTFIPALIAFIDAIILLTMSDENFNRKYGTPV